MHCPRRKGLAGAHCCPFTLESMFSTTRTTQSRQYVCLLVLTAGALFLACSRGDGKDRAPPSNRLSADQRGSSATTSASPPDSLRASVGAPHAAVASDAVTWDAQTVAGHLSGIGLMAGAVGVVARPMFRASGQRFRVNGGRAFVEAYFYGDANAVGFDSDKLDTIQVMPKGGTMQWEMPSRLIVDNNMAAVILTEDAALRKQIETALRSDLRGRTRRR